MTCKEAQLYMDGYLDRELDLIRMVDLERHLHECASCAALHRARMAVRATIPNLRYAAPVALKKSVGAAIAKQTPRRRVDWISLGAVAAGVAIVGALLLRPDLNRVEHEVVDSHIRSLMPGHLADVPSTDQHTVKPWFAGKLDFSPPVRDFASEGFPLVGGRVDYFDNHPVAVIVYRRNQHVINVFAWRSKESARIERTERDRGYNVIQLVNDGIEFWVVSDLNEEELRQFARMALE